MAACIYLWCDGSTQQTLLSITRFWVCHGFDSCSTQLYAAIIAISTGLPFMWFIPANGHCVAVAGMK